MIRLVAVIVVLLGLFFTSTVSAQPYPRAFASDKDAFAQCKTDEAYFISAQTPPETGCGDAANGGTYHLVVNRWGWDYTYAGPNPIVPCKAGGVIPSGTKINYSSATGDQCTQGANSCELQQKMEIGAGASSGFTTVQTGSACPSSATAPTTTTVKKPGDTTNANGTITSCDGIGHCVTYSNPVAPAPASAPVPADASGNTSTASTSKTDTPASSSSTTTTNTSTSTSSGSGTGSGSTGTGTGSTSMTDTPASSSSTSSKCTTGVCNVGEADGDVGTLYAPSTDTPSSVYSDFQSQVSNSPLISAATGFFSTSGIGGACPTWTIPGNKYWGLGGFSFTFFCSDAMLAIFAFAGILVLAVGAFSAFRIAIY